MTTVFKSRFRFPLNLLQRGYQLSYRDDAVNHCPGCGRTHWYIGRATAECAFCSTALPLGSSDMLGVGMVRHLHVPKKQFGEFDEAA